MKLIEPGRFLGKLDRGPDGSLVRNRGQCFGIVSNEIRLNPGGAAGLIRNSEQAFLAGFEAYVAKPVEPADLAQIIARLARRPNGEREVA